MTTSPQEPGSPDGSTCAERRTLVDPDEPTRRVQIRIERPAPASSTALPYVVVCHGFKGFMDWGFFPGLSRVLAENGFVCVSMNTSGSGIGDDPLVMDDDEAFFRDTYGRQVEDIARVRAFARTLEGVDPTREALLGHSRGGGAMILAAAAEAPRALVTWAAIDDVDRYDDATKARWRADGVLHVPNGRTGQVHRISVAALEEIEADPERFDIVAAAARIEAPFLAVHGTADATVDPGAAARLAAAAPTGRSHSVDGASHTFDAGHPCDDVHRVPALAETLDVTLAFLSETTVR